MGATGASRKKTKLSSPKPKAPPKAKARMAAQSPKAKGVTKPRATKPASSKTLSANASTSTKKTAEKENVDANLGRGHRSKKSTQDRLERDSLKIRMNPQKRKAMEDALEQEDDNEAAPPPRKRLNREVQPESPLRLTPPAPSKTIPNIYLESSPPRHASHSQQSQAFHRRSPSWSPSRSPSRRSPSLRHASYKQQSQSQAFDRRSLSRSPTMSPPRLGRGYKQSHQVIHSDTLDDGEKMTRMEANLGAYSDDNLNIVDKGEDGKEDAGSNYHAEEEDPVQSNNEAEDEDEVDGEGDNNAEEELRLERLRAQREEDRQRRERRRQEQEQQQKAQGGKGGASSQGHKSHNNRDYEHDSNHDRRRDHDHNHDRDHNRDRDRDHKEQQEKAQGGKGGVSSQGRKGHNDRDYEREGEGDHDPRRGRRRDHDRDCNQDQDPDHGCDQDQDRHLPHHWDRNHNHSDRHLGREGGGPSRGRDGREDLDRDRPQQGKPRSSRHTSSGHPPRHSNNGGRSGNQKERCDNDQGRDVLAQHRAKNRATRPPDSRKLAAHAQRQQAVEEDSNSEDDNNSEEEEEEENAGNKKRKPRTSTGVVTSLQEAFYPRFFRVVFGIVKHDVFDSLLNDHLYPNYDRLLPKIIKWLTDAVHYCEEELGLIQPDDIWEEYQGDMAKLIWNFIATLRGRWRDVAREVVPNFYKIRPVVEDFDGGFGQEEWADKMKDNVDNLITDSNFLKNGLDDQGRTNNLMAPAISELIFQIVHKPEDSVAKALPRRFKIYTGELISAVIVLLKVAIQEYATGRFVKLRFTETNYLQTYTDALLSVADMKGARDQHHWEKTRGEWAKWVVQHTIESGKKEAGPSGNRMVTLD
ncbi:hypothetical protein C8F04DRAFT_1391043 [Mycena alexandri]|uniref:DUF6532 domain-containing protein n=1 Tax=Mycena alexandri TaxID=1745969 RepID=A0AAD6T7Z3_9AGAR|nr:hypothetical protein C8F04DRAFT_1391043 [Mycena alexandri]